MGAENWRGQQHLRVGIEIQPESTRIDRMWVVNQPAVQATRLGDPILVRVETDGQTRLVQSFPDPRITRSTARDERGHHFGVTDSGMLVVSVPFTSPNELADVRVLLADISDLELAATSPQELAALFDERPQAMGQVRDLSTDDLRRSPDWVDVAAQLGLVDREGLFQIYLDAEERYRWRFLRGAEIIADSREAYDSRDACEADVQWLREHANGAAVTVQR